MRPFAVMVLVLVAVTARAGAPESLDAACSTDEHRCSLAATRAHSKTVARTDSALQVVRIREPLHHPGNTHPLSFDEVIGLRPVPDLLVDRLLRTGGPYLFALDTKHVQPEPVVPTLVWPATTFSYGDFRSAMPAFDMFPARVTGVVEFENATSNETWLKPASRVAGASLSPHTKLDPLHAEVLSRMRHVELLAQFEPPPRYARPADVLPQLSIMPALLLGLLVVMLRRAPLRSRPNGMWLVGTHT